MGRKLGEIKGNETTKLMNDLANGVNSTLEDALGEVNREEKEIREFSKEPTLADIQAKQAARGNTLLETPSVNDFSPDIQVSGRRAEALSSASISRPTVIDQTGNGTEATTTARGATKIDISKLDESMIMSMPFIKATANIVPGILFLKPKSANIRFRWVNFKNWEGGNYQKFKALGYQNAGVDDVDQEKTPVGDNCIDGTQIKWYDVILMKIDVFVLMGLYKANIMGSLEKVGRFQETALSQAQKQFNEALYNELVTAGKYEGQAMISAYKRLENATGKSLVQFYVPGLDGKSDKDFYSSQGDEGFISGSSLPT